MAIPYFMATRSLLHSRRMPRHHQVALAVLLALALPHALAAVTEASGELLAKWLVLPPDVPANIAAEEDLINDRVCRWISPKLNGGLGNVMFELAAGHALAAKIGVTCVSAWWENTRHPDTPFGGRPPPGPGLTLKHIFPNITFLDFYPLYERRIDINSKHVEPACRFDSFRKELSKAILSGEGTPDLPVVLGYFQSMRQFATIHKHRALIVDRILAFHPAVVDYVSTKYAALLSGPRETVSVHFRLGGDAEPGNGHIMFTDEMNELRCLPACFGAAHPPQGHADQRLVQEGDDARV